MKLHHLSLNTVKPKLFITSASGAVVGICSPTLATPQQTFRVVPDHSTARLFIGTPENPRAFNIAVARVSGESNIDADNLYASSFSVRVYAASESPASDSDTQALAGAQPVISFRSQHLTDGSDGMLRADGLLTVTQAERDAVANPGEDYSGPVYGLRLVHTSHAATFTFSRFAIESSADSSSGSREVRPPKTQQVLSEKAVLLTASTSINGETFPELLMSTRDTAWPAAVNEAECAIPSTVGEDYSGPQCKMSVVTPSSWPVLQVQIGEDYAGIRSETSKGNQVTIDLALVVTGADNGGAASSQDQPSAMGKAIKRGLQTTQP